MSLLQDGGSDSDPFIHVLRIYLTQLPTLADNAMAVSTTRRDPQDTDSVEIPLYVVHTLLFSHVLILLIV